MSTITTNPGSCNCEAAAMLDAIRALLCHPALIDTHEWAETSEHMTCAGAEAMSRVLRLLGQAQEAEDLLEVHCIVDSAERRTHDDYLPREGECLTCGSLPGQPHDPVRCLPDPDEDARELEAEQRRQLVA